MKMDRQLLIALMVLLYRHGHTEDGDALRVGPEDLLAIMLKYPGGVSIDVKETGLSVWFRISQFQEPEERSVEEFLRELGINVYLADEDSDPPSEGEFA